MADTWETNDDNPNAGKTTTPASSGADITKFNPNSPGGNGQKPTNNDTPNNPAGTSVRRWNPLTKFSSFTYGLTLYMLTPEAVNYFANNGKLPEQRGDGRYFIIAQSGGINSDSEPRAITLDPQGTPGPGKPGLDYYIDDFNVEIFLIAQDGQKTSTAATTMTFKVVEPIGFTFLTKLSNASKKINELSPLIQSGDVGSRPNLYQQHYMIGVKFYGYDSNGKLIENDTALDSDQALNDKYGMYERLFPLIVSRINFKIDGRATTYNWEANLQPVQAALSIKRGLVNNPATLEGATVGEILGSKQEKRDKSLMGWLNSKQVDLKTNKNIDIQQSYDITWVTNEWFDAEQIKNSPIITDPDVSSQTAAMSNAANVQQVTVKEASKSNSIDTKTKAINIAAGTSIVSVIDQIIVKSKYIADTLSKKINSRIEAETINNPKGELEWYSVKPLAKVIGRDKITKDWAYDITYEVVPYQVPYLKSQYVTARSKYYGPVKEYSYLLTGQNTEIVSFEMDYNNLFYVVTPATTTKDDPSKSSTMSNNVPRQPSGGINSNPTSGSLNSGSLIAESVRANLYTPADQAMVSIKIMGDPDFLMDTVGTKIQSQTFSKFYGKNNAVNPYGGQVFTEIIFKVAEDYKNDGLLDVDLDQTIGFYPKETQTILGNKGIIYRINKVQSTFSRGKFEQTLDMTMVHPSELIIPEDKKSEGRSQLNRIERQLETEENNNVPDSGVRTPSYNPEETDSQNENSDDYEQYSGEAPDYDQKPVYDNGSTDDDAAANTSTLEEPSDEDGRETDSYLVTSRVLTEQETNELFTETELQTTTSVAPPGF